MKRIFLILILLTIFISLIGCTRSSGFFIRSLEKNTQTKMSVSYKRFTGYKERDIKVDEEESITVYVDIVTDGGTIDVCIYKEHDKTELLYEEQDVQTSSNTVTLSEPGTYTIRVDGDTHKGSFSFSWE